MKIHSRMIRAIAAIFFAITIIAATMPSSVPSGGAIHIDGKRKFTFVNTETNNGQVTERTTDYFNESGKIIVKDWTRYYTSTLEVIESSTMNFITGGAEKTSRLDSRSYRLEYKKNASSKTEYKDIAEKEPVMSKSLLAERISRSYYDIAAGKSIEFRLIVPSRLESIGFELKKETEETVQGLPCLKISLRASSWIIRQFAGNINFWVNANPPHALVQYEGRVLPTDNEGNMLSGKIIYK